MVDQKTKIIELTNEYSVFDAAGKQLGAVRQTGQTTLKKALRLVSSVDQFMTHTLEVTDASRATQLTLMRPRKVFKSTIVVARPDGSEVGRNVQENVVGKIRFGIEANGKRVGGIQGSIGGRGTSRSRTTRARRSAASPRSCWSHCSLAVASALCVDTALKQDKRGGSTSGCNEKGAGLMPAPNGGATGIVDQAAGSTSRSVPVRTS